MYISVKIVGVVLVQDACSGGRPAQGEEAAAQSDDPGRRPASSRRGPARNIRNPCSLWPPAASSQQPAAAPLTRTGLWHKERGEHGHCTVGFQVAFDTLILFGFIYMLADLQKY